ncbi:GNAT family N-acetyltransferase [Kribbella sp. NPDC005582]|uniref:GNAT family N-acetyltransferase n=1 Tax=Kribbella sp. NPDC005582 TaxID=3156893 RepID=UPI0033BE05AF
MPQDFLDTMNAEAIATSWAASLAAGRSRLYVALTGELYALYVHPDHWGTGAGRALTDAAPTHPSGTSQNSGCQQCSSERF